MKRPSTAPIGIFGMTLITAMENMSSLRGEFFRRLFGDITELFKDFWTRAGLLSAAT